MAMHQANNGAPICLDGRLFDAMEQTLLVGGFLHASMSNLQNPHVDALPPFTMEGRGPGTSTHDPEPFRSGSGRLLLHRAELPYPCVQGSWGPAALDCHASGCVTGSRSSIENHVPCVVPPQSLHFS